MATKKPRKIALFNHKGGVAKTTSTFNLGWKLSELGVKVLLVDCDPQCNLTGLVLEYSQETEYPFETTDIDNPRNIKDAISPALDGRPRPIVAAEIQSVPGRSNLFILPGHVGLSEAESRLAIAHELSGSLPNFQNIPGALSFAIDKAAQKNSIDIVLIDLSPSLGALNQNALMSSDGFIIPMAPDFFSGMALRSLSGTLPQWAEWSENASANHALKAADYPWSPKLPKYFGAIVQNYRRRKRDNEVRPTRAFQKWFDDLERIKSETLLATLSDSNLLLDPSAYTAADAPLEDFMIEVPDFNGLIAISQDLSKPVFSLTRDELRSGGAVAANQLASVEAFNEIYASGAQKILTMSEHL